MQCGKTAVRVTLPAAVQPATREKAKIMTATGYTGPRRPFIQRMIAAATLDVSLYEEVEADGTATGQAALVVVLAAIAAAIGSLGENAIGGLIGALIGWAIWAGVTYFIGATLFKGTASWGELLRTLGFAQAPGLLYVVGIIPVLGAIAKLIIGIWVLVAGIIAIRQALDISTGKAVATALLGWLLLMILMAVFAGSAFVSGLIR
jgi:hypothetical protein